jgi:hypothetical protein
VATFRQLLELPIGMEPEQAQQFLAHNLFAKQIRPEFERIPKGDESQRPAAVSLLLQALHVFRDLHEGPEFLDFVFEELTNENKFRWIQVSDTGAAEPVPTKPAMAIHPPDILRQLAQLLPERYRRLEARQRISHRRLQDLKTQYFREISEYRHENRLAERRLAIEIIRKMKGLFLYYPDAVFLELPIRELEGHGRIRWNENFLGILPTQTNHYENRYFKFDYRQELSEMKMYRDTRQQWMEHVLREIGEL